MSNDAADELRERFDGFNYAYRMKCTCGRASPLSASDYHREVDDAHMMCVHCGASIHFGPAVTALRNDHDPALDDHHVAAFAWYHTSTAPDWPSVTHTAEVAEQVRQLEVIPRAQREYVIRAESTKALHLGTYEAAVENMFRRMHDEGDAGSQFYLHRVAVRSGRINDGYRDENHDSACDITVGELEADGLDAVRYLNVYEAPGSLSLAVRPGMIRWIQSIPIPVASPAEFEWPESLATLVSGVDAAALTHTHTPKIVSSTCRACNDSSGGATPLRIRTWLPPTMPKPNGDGNAAAWTMLCAGAVYPTCRSRCARR